MQQQASYKQVHAWTGKVLTTVHIGQSNFSEGLRNRPQLSEYTCRVFFPNWGETMDVDLLIQRKPSTF